MKATAQLTVPDSLRITLTLDMSVEEMKALLEYTKDVSRWPMGSFREVLRQSLGKASDAYASHHVIEP